MNDMERTAVLMLGRSETLHGYAGRVADEPTYSEDFCGVVQRAAFGLREVQYERRERAKTELAQCIAMHRRGQIDSMQLGSAVSAYHHNLMDIVAEDWVTECGEEFVEAGEINSLGYQCDLSRAEEKRAARLAGHCPVTVWTAEMQSRT